MSFSLQWIHLELVWRWFEWANHTCRRNGMYGICAYVCKWVHMCMCACVRLRVYMITANWVCRALQTYLGFSLSFHTYTVNGIVVSTCCARLVCVVYMYCVCVRVSGIFHWITRCYDIFSAKYSVATFLPT